MKGYFFPPTYLHDAALGALQLSSPNFIKRSYAFRAPKSGQLEEVTLRTQAVGASQPIRVSFQDKQATTYAPDEVIDQYVDVTFAANTFHVVGPLTHDGTAGGNRRTVAKGDWVCLVIEFVSTLGNVSFYRSTADRGQFLSAVDMLRNSVGTWSQSSTSGANMVFGLRYAGDTDYTPVQGAQPDMNIGTSTLNVTQSSSPDEVAVAFIAPYARAIIGGLWGFMTLNTGNASYDLILYDAADAILAQTTVPNMQAGTGSQGFSFIPFDADVVPELEGGSLYRLALRPNGATAITLSYLDFSTAAIKAGSPNLGYWSQRVNGGAWTDNLTRQATMMPLYIDDIPELNTEVVFNPDDLGPVGLVWLEAYLEE